MSRRGSPPPPSLGFEIWADTEGAGGPLGTAVSRAGWRAGGGDRAVWGRGGRLRVFGPPPSLPALRVLLCPPLSFPGLSVLPRPSPCPSRPSPSPGSPGPGGSDGVCPASPSGIIPWSSLSSWSGVPNVQVVVAVWEEEGTLRPVGRCLAATLLSPLRGLFHPTSLWPRGSFEKPLLSC